MTTESPRASRWPIRFGPLLVALAATGSVLATLDATGEYRGLGEGPGLTVDEMFNIQEGVRLVNSMMLWGAGEFHWKHVFSSNEDELGHQGSRGGFRRRPRGGFHLADHPPLGRFAIGISHELVRRVFPPETKLPSPFVVTAARVAPAVAYGLLIWLVGATVARWDTPMTGLVASVGIALMPRLFAHAHLAALETFVGLAYAAAVLSLASRWTRSETGPTWRDAIVPGLLFGLLLLTKIQAVLLPLPVAAWAMWHWRRRGGLPLATWSAIGLVVFIVGWPWLWHDVTGNLGEYFLGATDRVSLSVWYFGDKLADRDVAWHYPLVMFAISVPVGLHALAIVGLARPRESWRTDRRSQLVLAATLFPLLVFMIPGVAVYDGCRLFLVSFPLWAIAIGRGGVVTWEWLARRVRPRTATVVVASFVLLQGWGLVRMHPCQLSYYNLLVGGTRGAQALGLESSYWGDSVTRGLLEETSRQVPSGETIAVFPNLHAAQWPAVNGQSPLLLRQRIRLEVLGTPPAEGARYLLIFRRKADLPVPPYLHVDPPGSRRLAVIEREGVTLAVLYSVAGSQ